MKAKTKYYRKFLGVWVNASTDLTAALDGKTDVHPDNACGEDSFTFDKNTHFEHRPNHFKAKYVYELSYPQLQRFLVKEFKIKSFHKRYNYERDMWLSSEN